MSKYRKKPVVIEAIQWTGSNGEAMAEFIGDCGANLDDPLHPRLVISTFEGDMTADAGDWIIRGVKGEFYPVKPDIFSATYEKVEDAPAGEEQ